MGDTDLRNMKTVFEAVLHLQKLDLLKKLFVMSDVSTKKWLSQCNAVEEQCKVICVRKCRKPSWFDENTVFCVACLNE